MKTGIIFTTGLIGGLLVATSVALIAGEVRGLMTFSAGTPARAGEVNANFSAVATAVDDNNSRIALLESRVSADGNFTLPLSTATTGNIFKGNARFIHDFGANNVFVGANAGNFALSGVRNTAVGANALELNESGSDNTAIGRSALLSNTTGNENTASGAGALASNSTGGFNTATGFQALLRNTIGSGNTASGTNALHDNTTGISNTAHGASALQRNTDGFSNTASGASALASNITGVNNTAIGANALTNNATGSGNIAVGASAGTEWTTGSGNIAIGSAGVMGESSTIRIGTFPLHTRAFVAGIRGVTTANANAISVMVDSAGQLGTVSSSRRVKDDIADMGDASSVLMQLRPVSFYYKSDKNPAGRTLQYGLVAEEVVKAAPALAARAANGEIETVYYQFLAPMLLNEYQKQQRTIAAQTTRIAALERQAAEVAALKRDMAQMRALSARLGTEQRIAQLGR
jgi:hypothetical protein